MRHFLLLTCLQAYMVPLERKIHIQSSLSHGEVNKQCEAAKPPSNNRPVTICKVQESTKGGFQVARRDELASLELLDHP